MLGVYYEGGYMHLPTREEILDWPDFTSAYPMRILLSGCLSGALCGYDGTNYGDYPHIQRLIHLPNTQVITFCPEDFAFGTPRDVCNIYGGDGFDALEGRAKVRTDSGQDWTGPMIKAAHSMLKIAKANSIHLAILMDISAACGSQVIYDGPREMKNYRKGAGVCAALLMKNGYKVVSQRDYKTLELVLSKLDKSHRIDDKAKDHHETEWYKEYFREQPLKADRS
jgi:uncharacterized protein YbbK (DUF523 family)